MTNPTLYIFCGLPFSGKTVLTKILKDKLDYASVNIDEIKFSHGYEWIDDDHVPDEEWGKIFQESYELTLHYLKQGKSVLYDCANQDKASRDRLREIAAKGAFPTKVIWMDIPLDVIRRRYQTNKKTKERFDLPESIFQEAVDSYEPPTHDEQIIRYGLDTNLDTWIKTNF